MTHQILAIDDEHLNLILLEEYLSEGNYEITAVQSAKAGLEQLESGHKFHAILLDRMMAEMDGMEFLELIKGNDRYKHIPVIMQTAAATQDEIAEGIKAGVFYYLTKPFKKNVLLSILESALKDYSVYDDIKTKLEQVNAALTCVVSCDFSLKSLEDVTSLSYFIANLYPDPEAVIMGLRELMINAVEHGNLGITYDEKSELNFKCAWAEEVQRRLSLPEYKDKYATASFKKMDDQIVFTLEDQGNGFEWERFMEMDPIRATDNHGRGIAMSNIMSFDQIEYIAPGNKVICRKKLK
ncbi:MAG: response regulator [Methylomicrobium sp.]|nr:response regulator [Methylomicrobium sp.]